MKICSIKILWSLYLVFIFWTGIASADVLFYDNFDNDNWQTLPDNSTVWAEGFSSGATGTGVMELTESDPNGVIRVVSVSDSGETGNEYSQMFIHSAHNFINFFEQTTEFRVDGATIATTNGTSGITSYFMIESTPKRVTALEDAIYVQFSLQGDFVKVYTVVNGGSDIMLGQLSYAEDGVSISNLNQFSLRLDATDYTLTIQDVDENSATLSGPHSLSSADWNNNGAAYIGVGAKSSADLRSSIFEMGELVVEENPISYEAVLDEFDNDDFTTISDYQNPFWAETWVSGDSDSGVFEPGIYGSGTLNVRASSLSSDSKYSRAIMTTTGNHWNFFEDTLRINSDGYYVHNPAGSGDAGIEGYLVVGSTDNRINAIEDAIYVKKWYSWGDATHFVGIFRQIDGSEPVMLDQITDENLRVFHLYGLELILDATNYKLELTDDEGATATLSGEHGVNVADWDNDGQSYIMNAAKCSVYDRDAMVSMDNFSIEVNPIIVESDFIYDDFDNGNLSTTTLEDPEGDNPLAKPFWYSDWNLGAEGTGSFEPGDESGSTVRIDAVSNEAERDSIWSQAHLFTTESSHVNFFDKPTRITAEGWNFTNSDPGASYYGCYSSIIIESTSDRVTAIKDGIWIEQMLGSEEIRFLSKIDNGETNTLEVVTADDGIDVMMLSKIDLVVDSNDLILDYTLTLEDSNDNVVVRAGSTDTVPRSSWGAAGDSFVALASKNGVDLTTSTLLVDKFTAAPVPATCEELWNYGIVYGMAADINHDCIVDLVDLSMLASQWLVSGCSSGSSNWCDSSDIDQSGLVDSDDLELMAGFWLENNDPEAPE